MSTPFIPNQDSAFDAWLLNFKLLIAASPTSYGLVGSDSVIIAKAFDDWHGAYLAAVTPATRTAIAIKAKDAQRAVSVAVVRGYAAAIRSNAHVPADLQRGLGLHVRAAGLTRAPAPASVPVLSVTAVRLAGHTLIATDQHTPTRGGKPAGVAGLLVVRTIADTPTRDPRGAELLALSTRARFESEFTSADAGKIATYFARWTNSRGQTGPWSAALSARIAA